jgi:hypothetical protein
MPVSGFLCGPAHEIVAGVFAGIVTSEVAESISAYTF